MKVPRRKVLQELRLSKLRLENLGPETDKDFQTLASEISRRSALVQKENKPVNTLVKGKSWAKERDSVLFWETKHQKGDPRTVFGSRFHVIQADPFDNNEAKIFKYKRPCIFCGSRFACRIPIRRMKRFTPGLRNPWAELGTMVTKKTLDFAAHQKCLDYASGVGMVQDFMQPFEDHLDGFNIEAIIATVNNSAKFKCYICGFKGAATQCAKTRCTKTGFYHLPCGIRQGSEQISGEKKSFCPRCAGKDVKLPRKRKQNRKKRGRKSSSDAPSAVDQHDSQELFFGTRSNRDYLSDRSGDGELLDPIDLEEAMQTAEKKWLAENQKEDGRVRQESTSSDEPMPEDRPEIPSTSSSEPSTNFVQRISDVAAAVKPESTERRRSVSIDIKDEPCDGVQEDWVSSPSRPLIGVRNPSSSSESFESFMGNAKKIFEQCNELKKENEKLREELRELREEYANIEAENTMIKLERVEELGRYKAMKKKLDLYRETSKGYFQFLSQIEDDVLEESNEADSQAPSPSKKRRISS